MAEHFRATQMEGPSDDPYVMPGAVGKRIREERHGPIDWMYADWSGSTPWTFNYGYLGRWYVKVADAVREPKDPGVNP